MISQWIFIIVKNNKMIILISIIIDKNKTLLIKIKEIILSKILTNNKLMMINLLLKLKNGMRIIKSIIINKVLKIFIIKIN